MLKRAALMLMLLAPVAGAQGIKGLYPKSPEVFVADEAHLLGTVREALNAKSKEVQTRTGGDIEIVTLPTIGDYAPNEVAMNVGRDWRVGGYGGAGSAQRNLGAVILVVPKTASHKGQCFIAPGTGAEGFLTDASASGICRSMVEYFKRGDYAGGVSEGQSQVAGLIMHAVAPVTTAQKEANARALADREPGVNWGLVGFILLTLLVLGSLVWLGWRAGRRSIEVKALLEEARAKVWEAEAKYKSAQTTIDRQKVKAVSEVDLAKSSTKKATLDWSIGIVQKYSKEPVSLLVERLQNNGESMAEKTAREVREAEERRIKAAVDKTVADFSGSLRHGQHTEDSARAAAAKVAIPKGASEPVVRAALAGAVAAWIAEMAAAAAAKRRREEEAERQRQDAISSSYSSSSYSSSSDSSSFDSNTLGGGGGYDGGGGGSSW